MLLDKPSVMFFSSRQLQILTNKSCYSWRDRTETFGKRYILFYLIIQYCAVLILSINHVCAQAAEDTRRANDTIAARDAELNTLRTTIKQVIPHTGSFPMCCRL
jgi:hypothetical protein